MAQRGGGAYRLLRPRLLPLHALAVLATIAAVLLGLWQYDVWHSHRADAAAARAQGPAEPLSRVLSADDAFPRDAAGRPVEITGRWLPGDTLFVAGKEAAGRSGLWVLTPVAVCRRAADCPRSPAVLVVRGWVPSRSQAPSAPTGAVRLTGWLQPGEGSADVDPNPGDDVLPQLRVADAVQHVEQDLYSGYVIARSPREDGLTAVSPASLPSPGSFTSLRNLLYALEWWVFGGFAVYLWWRWCRDEVALVTEVPSNA